MTVRTGYALKWPFSVNLSRAILKPFRLEEFITFDGSIFKLGVTLLTKFMSLCNEKIIIVSSPALETFPIVTQIMFSCSYFDVQVFF